MISSDSWVIQWFAFCVLVCIVVNADALSVAKRPHIVFILIDDMGFNDFYTSTDLAVAWPNVAQMRQQECIELEQYYTMALCTPSRAAFMTGRMPIRLGLQHATIGLGQAYGLPLTEVTLATKLANAGYVTIGVGKWHLGMYSSASFPTHRGFRHWYGYMAGSTDYFNHTLGEYLDLYDDDVVDYNQTGVYATHLFKDKVAMRIREHRVVHKDAPLFLYYAMQNVHFPLETIHNDSVACRGITDKNRRAFCELAKSADEAIGNVTQELDIAFPGEDMLIVISGDNGGMIEYGGNNCPDVDGLCLRGQKGALFEGGIRNNAIVCSKTMVPQPLKGATYSNGLVHIMDWHVVFRDLAQRGESNGETVDGLNVLPAIIQNQPSPRKEFLVNIDPCDYSNCTGQDAAYRFQGCLGQDDIVIVDGPTVQTWQGTMPSPSVEEESYTDDTLPHTACSQTQGRLTQIDLRTATNIDQETVCGDWKLVSTEFTSSWFPVPGIQGIDDSFQFASRSTMLFDLSTDPSERHDLAQYYPFVVAALKSKVDAFVTYAVVPCNLPGGSCITQEQLALDLASQRGAWVPWVTHCEAEREEHRRLWNRW